MSDISRINPFRVPDKYNLPSGKTFEETPAPSENEEEIHTPVVNHQSPDSVLNFMGNNTYRADLNANNVKITGKESKIVVSNYVTDEQATRIGANANQAMNMLFGMEKYGKGMGLSTTAAQAVAVQTFESRVMIQD